MRWTESGSVTSEGSQVLYSGGDEHERGVGLIVSEWAKKCLATTLRVSYNSSFQSPDMLTVLLCK